jgi:hypothetical protein
MTSMWLLGVLLIVSSIAAGAWWSVSRRRHKAWALTFSLLGVFAGCILLLSERAVEISIEGIGTIKAAAHAAEADAALVASLRKRVEAQSATVDLVAKTATEAETLAKELQSTLDFATTLIAAGNDDRAAFERLQAYAGKKDRLSPLAAQAFIQVRTKYGGAVTPGYLNLPSPSALENAPMAQILSHYSKLDPLYRASAVKLVWSRDDIAQSDRMDFLAQILSSDPSLAATHYAAEIFAKNAGLAWSPFNVQPLLDWWHRQRE